jgi:hypothetical protein
MTLTNDELGRLQRVACACESDGSFEVFERSLVPWLAELAEGELWALAGMFAGIKGSADLAAFIAAYARKVREALAMGPDFPRPDPVQFLENYVVQEASPVPPFGLLRLRDEIDADPPPVLTEEPT